MIHCCYIISLQNLQHNMWKKGTTHEGDQQVEEGEEQYKRIRSIQGI